MQAVVLTETDGKNVYFNWSYWRFSEDKSDKQLLLQAYNFFTFLFLGLSAGANRPNMLLPFKIAHKNSSLSNAQWRRMPQLSWQLGAQHQAH